MMKKLAGVAVATVMIALWSPIAWAQQASDQVGVEQRTKLETFQAQTGTVVIKGYSEVGSVSALGVVAVDSMEFTDAATGQKVSGVVIEITESGRLENSDRSFIDYDEVDSLLAGLDYISKATPDVTELGQFEATYKTKGNFSATTFNNGRGEISAAVKCGYVRAASAYLSLEQLTQLRGLILSAKQKLDSVK